MAEGSDGSDDSIGITDGFSSFSVVLFTLLSRFPSEILIGFPLLLVTTVL
jgi:hypothetical protein